MTMPHNEILTVKDRELLYRVAMEAYGNGCDARGALAFDRLAASHAALEAVRDRVLARLREVEHELVALKQERLSKSQTKQWLAMRDERDEAESRAMAAEAARDSLRMELAVESNRLRDNRYLIDKRNEAEAREQALRGAIWIPVPSRPQVGRVCAWCQSGEPEHQNGCLLESRIREALATTPSEVNIVGHAQMASLPNPTWDDEHETTPSSVGEATITLRSGTPPGFAWGPSMNAGSSSIEASPDLAKVASEPKSQAILNIDCDCDCCRNWREREVRTTVGLREHDARVTALVEALRGLLAEPYGCTLCDSGKPRDVEKGHQPTCTYEVARRVLTAWEAAT